LFTSIYPGGGKANNLGLASIFRLPVINQGTLFQYHLGESISFSPHFGEFLRGVYKNIHPAHMRNWGQATVLRY